jgi:DNA adenine methylase
MMKPFLKWPGGKRWVAARIAAMIKPRLSGRYFEPFLGGAAVFFSLRPAQCVLSDINPDLINTYKVVRDRIRGLINEIRGLRVSEATYYELRSRVPSDPVARAARFLYLNRTAFAGMYRLNSKGEFNVPYGGERTPDALWKGALLKNASAALRHADLCACDFEFVLDAARVGDVVYCDPTYTVVHNNNGFKRYNEKNFSWDDQERLARAAVRARRRGASVLVSNAHHFEILKLYRGAQFLSLARPSTLSADPDKRREISEYLIIL